jgi:hypothetical protein
VFTSQLSAYGKYRQLPQRERVCALSAVVWPILVLPSVPIVLLIPENNGKNIRLLIP